MQDSNNVFNSEQWKPIPGHEQFYAASTFGRIKRISGIIRHNKGGHKHWHERILRPISNRGYESIMLSINNRQKIWRVHRLVAMTFIPNPDNKPYINHKNGQRNDNRMENLEWCNNSENQKHAYSQLGKVNPKAALGKIGHLCKNSKPVLQIDCVGNVLREWCAIADVNRELGFSQPAISRSCKTGYKTKGYYWQFKTLA